MLLCGTACEPAVNIGGNAGSSRVSAGTMRPPVLPALIGVLVALAPVALTRGGPASPPVRATPLPLDSRDPARTTLGVLRFTGGWVLHSRDRRFGGLSALAARAPGHLLAISDSGVPVDIRIGPAGPVARILPRLDTGTGRRSGKWAYDVESLAAAADGRTLWAGLERRNVIARYDGALRLQARRAPPEMKEWPGNGGAEAMARLPDGRMLVLAEVATEGAAADRREALIFPGDAAGNPRAARRLSYRPPAGYDPSDAAALPDGRVLVLNRAWRLPLRFSSAITLVDPRKAGAGAVLEGPVIARLAAPLATDNMEGMAIVREADGLILYLVSDDNFLPVQRTLLLRFRLAA